MVLENLRKSFPDKNEAAIKQIAGKFYHHLCDIFVETIKMLHISDEEMKQHVTVTGMSLMEEVAAGGHPVFLLIGHYGNWEWISSMPLWVDPKLCLCTQLYHPMENYVTDQLLLYTRNRFGGVSITADKSIKYMVSYRRQGKPILVGFIADQAPYWDNIYYWSQFLNHETPWFTGAERIMQKLDMDVYYLDVRRIRRGYYVAEYKRITTDPKSKEQFWLTEQYSRMLERTISRAPSYWLWSHRRWKRTKEEWLRITNGGIKPKN